jgi:RNA polymerase sigma-70 factor (ECF subfamily)
MIKISDEDLVEQILSGKRKAFETLVERYQKTIFNVAYRSTKNYDDSQDITQAVFIKAFENLPNFNPTYRFFSWLYRIAVNESINYINQRKQLKRLDGEVITDNTSLDEKFAKEELTNEIQNALMEIDMNYRIVIILKHFQSCSYKEISYILDIPEKTVKSRLYSARQMLKVVLQKKGAIYYD